MRVNVRAHQNVKIDHVYDAQLHPGNVLSQQPGGGHGFKRRHVSGAGQHDVRLAAVIVAGEFPDGGALRAMRNGVVHIEPLQGELLAAGDDVHVVAAAQAMIDHAEQAIGVRRIVDADHLAPSLQRVIDEAGRLMAEAIVVVAPDVAGDENIQRCDGAAPRIFARLLQPFACCVIIESTTWAKASYEDHRPCLPVST